MSRRRRVTTVRGLRAVVEAVAPPRLGRSFRLDRRALVIVADLLRAVVVAALCVAIVDGAVSIGLVLGTLFLYGPRRPSPTAPPGPCYRCWSTGQISVSATRACKPGS